ncbi:MAG: nucleotidyltransferase domain-containing protein [Thermodesulfovibrionales bacterium]|nr:nucleotidyltransferase domain-containing protein [Nitrospinota bacterium]MCG2710325.1 nucleotidyltransferase domain-containing protein [Thermodesulfovibrionales bacterium]
MIKYEKLPKNILSRIQNLKNVLLQDDNIVFAYLFGGLTKGEVKDLSDIDIAVYLKDTGNLAGYKLQLFDRLSNALGTSELDLVMLNTVSLSIAGRILQNKKLLIDKEPFRRHIYESVTLREFFDFKVKEDAFFARRYGIG